VFSAKVSRLKYERGSESFAQLLPLGFIIRNLDYGPGFAETVRLLQSFLLTRLKLTNSRYMVIGSIPS
jgi:hypothetical protein